MRKPKARVTVMFEFEVPLIEGMTAEQSLEVHAQKLKDLETSEAKIYIVRKEIV